MKNTLTTKKHETLRRVMAISLVFVFAMAFMSMFNITPTVFADTEDTLNGVLTEILKIVKMAATYIGIVIAVWGVFQIVLAFRREDSEGISKQITTVVVGAVLAGFGIFAQNIASALGIEVDLG